MIVESCCNAKCPSLPESPQIQGDRPLLVPQVTTQQLIPHVMTEEVQADAAIVQSVENFAEGPQVQTESFYLHKALMYTFRDHSQQLFHAFVITSPWSSTWVARLSIPTR